MKQLILTALLISTNVFAGALHNFQQIKEAVITGKAIHIAIDFAKCTSQQNFPCMNVGVFTPNAMQVMDNTILTSMTHFTLNNRRFSKKPVYEFLSYKITAENVKLTYRVLDATNYNSLAPKLTLNCRIDSAAKIYY